MTRPVEILSAVQVGTVIAWYPPLNAQLPPGFVRRDGRLVTETDSPYVGLLTPNLINRFVLGAGGDVAPNQLRGSVDRTGLWLRL
jgi:hypothetical protein